MLNAIGLQGIACIGSSARRCLSCGASARSFIVNVCGSSIGGVVEVSRILSDLEGVAALELNISCPNIKEAVFSRLQPGERRRRWWGGPEGDRLPLIPKLTPQRHERGGPSRGAAEENGAGTR